MTRRVDLIGVPTDVHSSFLRGCAQAPPLIRAALFSPHGNEASERGLELGGGIALKDCGDLPLREALSDDAVIEAAVLVSRLHMLPPEKIDSEMAYLKIAINKTAGPEEHEAWGWLQEAVAKHRAAQKPAP